MTDYVANIYIVHANNQDAPGTWIRLDKDLEQVAKRIANKGYTDWLIQDYNLYGYNCKINPNQSLKSVVNMAMLLKAHGGAIAAFINGLYEYFGSYEQELEFDDEEEFLEKFHHYFVDIVPGEDDFAMWLDEESYFPEIAEACKKYSQVNLYFDWKAFSRDLLLNDEFWLSTIPANEWETNNQGDFLTTCVFHSLNGYEDTWRIPR